MPYAVRMESPERGSCPEAAHPAAVRPSEARRGTSGRRFLRSCVAAALVALALAPWSLASERADDPDGGAEMLGRPAPAWSFDRWIRSRPLALRDLRGKVVLLRWWTEGCHFCAETLPAIETLRHGRDAGDLVVIGVFHPKPVGHVSNREIVATAERLGFAGPIAVDERWTTLDRYWLTGHPERNWTSVSFLIDRDGIVRWVQGGGEYHASDDPRHARCDLTLRGLERAIADALARKPAARAS